MTPESYYALMNNKNENKNRNKWKQNCRHLGGKFIFFSTNVILTTSGEISDTKFLKLLIYSRFTDMKWAPETQFVDSLMLWAY